MRIKIKVKTNAKKEGCEQKPDGSLVVSVKAPPRDGKANERVIELLKSKFGKNSFPKIVFGARSKSKIIEL